MAYDLSEKALEEQLCGRLGTSASQCRLLAEICTHDYEQACLALTQQYQLLMANRPVDSVERAWARLVEFKLNFYTTRLRQALPELDEASQREAPVGSGTAPVLYAEPETPRPTEVRQPS